VFRARVARYAFRHAPQARSTGRGERAMDITRSVAGLRARVASWRAEGLTVGLTPTMGALHEGHLTLVALARRHADRVVATIFVNPTQFGPTEDFAAYPRDEGRDAAMLESAGCDLLYAPTVAEMYPPGFATEVRVSGLTDVLCGAARPGHFDGVAQVVTKYLNQAQADVAVFGEKDWQQLAVIRRLAADLDIPTRILGAPVARDPDGLAMSSRNRYLTDAERAAAPALHAALRRAAGAIRDGGDVAAALGAARAAVLGAGFARIDYLEARDGSTLAPMAPDGIATGRLFAAAFLGRARLIDNVPVTQ
jgi:pantoate--beta-alanine ligase